MIGQFSMWELYFRNLIYTPLNLYILIIAFILSVIFYFLFKRAETLKKKISYLAMHIVLIVFPFVFSAFYWKCVMSIMHCGPMAFILFIISASIISGVLGFMFIPFLFRWSNKDHIIDRGYIKNFIKRQSKKLKIQEPTIHFTNELKPMAYSITNLKPSIFITTGLSEMLSKKEMESVLLHELYHHKTKAYFWKFSINMLKIFTPLSTFINTSQSMEKEELEADNFAVLVQKTDKYLNSAKRKIETNKNYISKF